MVIRHAEKPDRDSEPYGVTRKGLRDKESLQVRGWQRAGALIGLFAPPNGHVLPLLAQPKHLYASKPLRRHGSKRPYQTILPLSERLRIEINSEYPRYDLKALMEEIHSLRGEVLISWQREYIPAMASLILDNRISVPAEWPEDRYDMVWVFDLDVASNQYRFKQVPQKLMCGDVATPIR